MSAMEFRKQKPIYLQIADTLSDRILQGEWQGGVRFPSVREVAADLGVNPNTVMRAFDHLQQQEVIFNRRGIGYFVGEDAKKKILEGQKAYFMEEELPFILQRMEVLGISISDLEAISQKNKTI